MNTGNTNRGDVPAPQEAAPGNAAFEELPNNEKATDTKSKGQSYFDLIDGDIEETLGPDKKLEQVKDFGSLVEGVIYRDMKTGTLWFASEDRWTCAVCDDSRWLCRGCGGMSSLYPQLFGCCSMQVFCPNCVTLHAPHDDSSVVGVVDMHVDAWVYPRLHRTEEANIVSFKPKTDRCFLVVKKLRLVGC